MNKDFLIIAHRGDSSLCPENTMAAFRKAVEVGSDGIETDVHLTEDGKVVISHDGSLGRVCNGKGNISDYTYDELKKFDAGSWFSEDFKGERLPLLEELLDLLKDKDMILNIEIKGGQVPYEGIEEKVLQLIDQYKLRDNIIISSFDHYSLVKFKKIAPDLKTGILYGNMVYKPYDYAKTVGAESLHAEIRTLNQGVIKQSINSGLKIYPYIGGEKFSKEYGLNVMNSGISGIITNFPQEYVKLR